MAIKVIRWPSWVMGNQWPPMLLMHGNRGEAPWIAGASWVVFQNPAALDHSKVLGRLGNTSELRNTFWIILWLSLYKPGKSTYF